MAKAVNKALTVIIKDLYSFERRNKSVIHATDLTTGASHHVGIRFTNILRKSLKTKHDLEVTNEDLYEIIIRLSRIK